MKKYYIYTLSKDKLIFYIGKTLNLDKRLASHKTTYGSDILLEVLDETTDWKSTEVFWIEQFKQWGFNLKNKNKGGGGRDYQTEEIKIKIGNNQPKNKFRNPETNIKIGLSNKGLKKKPCSDERKHKISESNKGKQFNLGKKYNTITFKKVIQYDLQNNLIKEWDSVKEILHYLGKKQNNMSIYRCLQGQLDTAYKFKWKYKITENE
jgi:hypothetical protein